MIRTAGPEKLKIFVGCLNNLRSTIKLACSHSPSNIPFLDVMVSVKDGSIETDLYTKRTDKHQYLLVSCCHPQHTKRTIPFSLPLRLRRICSNPDNYKLRTNELIDYLANRSYGKTFLKTQIQRASDILRIYKQTQDSDDLYSTLLVITSILQFQNTFLPVIIPTIICFWFLLKNLKMGVILSGKHVKPTLSIKLRQLTLWASINVMNYNYI